MTRFVIKFEVMFLLMEIIGLENRQKAWTLDYELNNL